MDAIYKIEKRKFYKFLTFFVLAFLITKPYPGFLGGAILRALDFSSIVFFGILLMAIFLFEKNLTINYFSKRTLIIIFFIMFWQMFVLLYQSIFGEHIVVAQDFIDIYKPLIIFCAFLAGAVLSKGLNRSFFEKLIKFFAIFQFVLCLIQLRFGGISLGLFSGRDLDSVIYEFSHRAVGTFGNPNFLGIFMATCAGWYFYRTLYLDKKNIIMFLVSFTTVMLTQSRTSTLITIIFCVLILITNVIFYRKHKIRGIFLLILFSLGCFFGYKYIQNTPYTSSQFSYLTNGIRYVISGNVIEQSSFHGRTEYWANMYEYIKKHPFIGSGPGKGNIEAPKVADNNYIFILYKYGLVGLFLWLLLITHICINLMKHILKKDNAYKDVCVFASVFWFVLLSSAFLVDNIEHIRYAPITFFISGLCLNSPKEFIEEAVKDTFKRRYKFKKIVLN